MPFQRATLPIVLTGLVTTLTTGVAGQAAADAQHYSETSFLRVPNTYCEYYKQEGGGDCLAGKPFDHAWGECVADGATCMGILWNPCTGSTSDTSVNGAWKLLTAGQVIGSADYPTATCGGKNQARGHWDAYIKSEPYAHIPNTYCEYYKQGGDGDCSAGRAFVDVWKECERDGKDKCMGVLWNSCTGPTSDISVNGAWKLLKAGQKIGDANNPTATCGGKAQALGHWDAFVQATPTNVALGKLTTQSSTRSQGGESKRAVDGNRNGRLFANSVTHTRPTPNPFWYVDLGEEYSVHNVKIFNRSDCCQNRLDFAIITLLDEFGRPIMSKKGPDDAGDSFVVEFIGADFRTGLRARYVMVSLTTVAPTALSLAEVEVYATPANF